MLSSWRATAATSAHARPRTNFYPRSPCGERHRRRLVVFGGCIFLSTLSLRRATAKCYKKSVLFVVKLAILPLPYAIFRDLSKSFQRFIHFKRHFFGTKTPEFWCSFHTRTRVKTIFSNLHLTMRLETKLQFLFECAFFLSWTFSNITLATIASCAFSTKTYRKYRHSFPAYPLKNQVYRFSTSAHYQCFVLTRQ